jgi:lactoylglutathione lyase
MAVTMTKIFTIAAVLSLSVFHLMEGPKSGQSSKPKASAHLDLGMFSISLTVKDLAASRAFYEKLGFSKGGGEGKKWIVLRNGTSQICLFQGMLEKNSLYFNPGWSQTKENLEKFTDIREIQRRLKAAGLKLDAEADESTKGPASITLTDPDGNPVLIDQLGPRTGPSPKPEGSTHMDLGAFSISLKVKDLAGSRAFYEKLGFSKVAGDGKKWAIMRNGTSNIGLFQGGIEKNSITFNPGWSNTAENLDKFTDVRELQRQLKNAGLKLDLEADESTKGPAFITLTDPDGNPVLIDQHR